MNLDRYYSAFTLQRQSGGVTIVNEPSYSDVGTYRGFIQPRSGSESGAFQALTERYSHVLYTDTSTPVQFGDRVVQSGVTYRAVFTVQPTGIAGRSHHKEIALQYMEM